MLPLGHMGVTIAVVRVLERSCKLPWIDYRVLLVASLLPDLIDKPIEYFFFTNTVFYGRHFGHSLWFILILFIVALVHWYYRNNRKVLILSIGVLIHNILDVISHYRGIVFEPIYQSHYSGLGCHDWGGRIANTLLSTSKLVVLEVIGLCILTYFFIKLVLNNKVGHFVKTGEL